MDLFHCPITLVQNQIGCHKPVKLEIIVVCMVNLKFHSQFSFLKTDYPSHRTIKTLYTNT